MIKIGALWLKKSKNGETLSGKFGDAIIIAIPVANKKSEQSPDYEIYIKEADKKSFAAQPSNQQSNEVQETSPVSKSADSGYEIKFGKFKGSTLSQVNPSDLRNYVSFLEGSASKKGEPLKGGVAEFVLKAREFLR